MLSHLGWSQVRIESPPVSIVVVWLLGPLLRSLSLLLILLPIPGWLKDSYGQFVAIVAAPAFVDVVDAGLGVAVR